jgi:copper homeostasis protein
MRHIPIQYTGISSRFLCGLKNTDFNGNVSLIFVSIMILEVCCNSLDSALAAQSAGAHRIEFCTGLALGGLTPSMGLLKEYTKIISLPTRVLIRPRGGDFSYTSGEFNSMLEDIAYCKELGFEGVVSGILQPDGNLDVARTAALVASASGMKFTFHRAFDWVLDPQETLLKLSKMGVHSLLSSGTALKAVDGLDQLKALKEMSTAVEIMPGGGVNAQNALVFKEAGFKAIHLSGVAAEKVLVQTPKVSMHTVALLSDTHRFTTQENRVKDVLSLLENPH